MLKKAIKCVLKTFSCRFSHTVEMHKNGDVVQLIQNGNIVVLTLEDCYCLSELMELEQ